MKFLILLFGLLPLQDDSSARKWIDRLDSKKAAVRDKAAEELLALGTGAIAPLRSFLKNPSNDDTRIRAAALLEKIEWKYWLASIKGGDVVGGLQLRLLPTRPSYRAGKTARFRLEVKNVGARATDFILPQKLDHFGLTYESTCTASHGELELKRIRPVQDEDFHTSISCGSRPSRKSIRLKTGETWTRDVEIIKGELGTPGTYELTFEYYAGTRKLVRGAETDLKSNTYRFEVK